MKLTLVGTGNVQASPLYGCECLACQRARKYPSYARKLCSALLESEGKQWLIDANHPLWASRFPAHSLSGIFLTHYHMDHVQALFNMRWAIHPRLPVYQPDDPKGCDDLFKHPGILDFQPPLKANQAIHLDHLRVIPLALNHSKPCLGYLFCVPQGRIAYLTDTKGIPDSSWQQLLRQPPKYVVIDCSNPPSSKAKNHNNLSEVLELAHALPDSHWLLTHIGHELDDYLLEHPDCLSPNVSVAHDEQCLSL
ncbi:phosphonate metabolism protein PhnP [Agarivorans sp.]|uniref:phosphonate metabolism protein PhnP n=1 Tax=Agarivorans sp. TaxID=1872412 RepID=UPI003CFE8E37